MKYWLFDLIDFCDCRVQTKEQNQLTGMLPYCQSTTSCASLLVYLISACSKGVIHPKRCEAADFVHPYCDHDLIWKLLTTGSWLKGTKLPI